VQGIREDLAVFGLGAPAVARGTIPQCFHDGIVDVTNK
jgi:hypothetical protein